MLTLNAFIITMLMNCAPSSYGRKDNELQPYVNEFYKTAILFEDSRVAYQTLQSRVVFGKVDKQNYAECYVMTGEILIDKTMFMTLSHENREELIFHELGHCAMNKFHEDTGIMKEAGLHNPQVYKRNYKKLINELFDCESGDCREIQYDENKYKQGKKMSKKEEILENEHAVVRFTADWCGPCKALKPIFDEVAIANPKVKVYVIDVDKEPDVATEFGVRGIPTLLNVTDKTEGTRLVGLQSKEQVEELFKK